MEGYAVVERPDGRSAQKALAAGGVDLAVLDLGPPGIHGDLLSDVRHSGRAVPVIILSGRGEEAYPILG